MQRPAIASSGLSARSLACRSSGPRVQQVRPAGRPHPLACGPLPDKETRSWGIPAPAG